MANKKHCDVCDSVKGDPAQQTNHVVRIEHAGIMHEVRVETVFATRYPHERIPTIDICLDCQRKVAIALAAKYGVTPEMYQAAFTK